MLDEMQPAFDYSDATKSQNNSAAGGIETGHESLVSRSVNSDQEIPGTRRDISTIIMQCIQLPAGLDSPDKEVISD
jgi:hypothetical protein